LIGARGRAFKESSSRHDSIYGEGQYGESAKTGRVGGWRQVFRPEQQIGRGGNGEVLAGRTGTPLEPKRAHGGREGPRWRQNLGSTRSASETRGGWWPPSEAGVTGIPRRRASSSTSNGERQSLRIVHGGRCGIFASRLLNERPPMVFERQPDAVTVHRNVARHHPLGRGFALERRGPRQRAGNPWFLAQRRHGKADVVAEMGRNAIDAGR